MHENEVYAYIDIDSTHDRNKIYEKYLEGGKVEYVYQIMFCSKKISFKRSNKGNWLFKFLKRL